MRSIGDLNARGRSYCLLAIIAPILATACVLTRIWIRVRITKSFGADDVFLLISLLFFIGLSIVNVLMALWGFGEHTSNVSDEEVVAIYKMMFTNGIFLALTIVVLRLSICWFFLRITIIRWQRNVIYAAAAICSIVQIVNVFWTTIFYCHPISKYWYVDIPGSCIPNSTLTTLYYLQYATDIASDWTISILPMFMLFNANMKTRLKIITAGLLAMGILASVSSMICIVFTQQASNTDDYIYTSYAFFTAQPVEPFIGILATSCATFRPLVRRIIEARTGSGTNGRGYKASHSRWEDLEGRSNASRLEGPRKEPSYKSPKADSQTSLVDEYELEVHTTASDLDSKKGGITKTSQISSSKSSSSS